MHCGGLPKISSRRAIHIRAAKPAGKMLFICPFALPKWRSLPPRAFLNLFTLLTRPCIEQRQCAKIHHCTPCPAAHPRADSRGLGKKRGAKGKAACGQMHHAQCKLHPNIVILQHILKWPEFPKVCGGQHNEKSPIVKIPSQARPV